MPEPGPLDAPLIELSRSLKPHAETPIPVLATVEGEARTFSPNTVPGAEVIVFPHGPMPELLTFTLPAQLVVVQICSRRPYRRLVTLLTPQNAMTVEFSYDQHFKAPCYALVPANLSPIPVFAGQDLFARQRAAVDLDVSILIEPRSVYR